MSEQEIIEGNKLIAEFMGGITSNMNNRIVQGYQNIWLPFHGICNWGTIKTGNGKILLYHSSWDWLMPVVEKIKNISGAFINSDSQDEKFAYLIFSLSITTPIETVYIYVINFIKWYNTWQKEL